MHQSTRIRPAGGRRESRKSFSANVLAPSAGRDHTALPIKQFSVPLISVSRLRLSENSDATFTAAAAAGNGSGFCAWFGRLFLPRSLRFFSEEERKEYSRVYIESFVLAVIHRIFMLAILYTAAGVLRYVFGDHDKFSERDFLMISLLHVLSGLVMIALVTCIMLKRFRHLAQQFMSIVILLPLITVIFIAQIGSNQLLKKWPLHTVLSILGVMSIYVKLRFYYCLGVTVVTNVAYIALIFINTHYTDGTLISLDNADILATVFFLLLLSSILIGSSFNSEKLLLEEFRQLKKVARENERLRKQVKEQNNADANAETENMIKLETQLESILKTFRTVLNRVRVNNILTQDEDQEFDEAITALATDPRRLLEPKLSYGPTQDNGAIDASLRDWIKRETFPAEIAQGESNTVDTLSDSDEFSATDTRRTSAPLNMDFTEKLRLVKQELENWNADFLMIDELCGGRSMTALVMTLLRRHNVDKNLRLERKKLEKYFGALEHSYNDLPYHNRMHAADVCHSFHYMLQKCDAISNMSSLQIFACIVASAGHDAAHPGLNNAYLITTRSHEAMIYNDTSVLENFHIATLFRAASDPSCDIFSSLSDKDYRTVRKLIVEMVLATDLAKHFQFITSAKTKVSAIENPKAYAWFTGDDLILSLCLGIKMADLGHFTKSAELHNRWNDLVLEEFYRQGDRELKEGLPISPFMDRNVTRVQVGKNQTGFIGVIVEPLFTLCAQIYVNLDEPIQQLRDNTKFWKSVRDGGFRQQSIVEMNLAGQNQTTTATNTIAGSTDSVQGDQPK